MARKRLPTGRHSSNSKTRPYRARPQIDLWSFGLDTFSPYGKGYSRGNTIPPCD